MIKDMKKRLWSRRGSLLSICLILIPIGAAAMMLALEQIDVSRRATEHRERRVQARLLAESALNVLQARGGKGAVAGEIEGAGTYRVEADPAVAGSLRAVGVTVSAANSGGKVETEERIGYRGQGSHGKAALAAQAGERRWIPPREGWPPPNATPWPTPLPGGAGQRGSRSR